MNFRVAVTMVTMLLTSFLVSSIATAGVIVVGPVWRPRPYPYPYYVYPPVPVVIHQPEVYVEQAPQPSAPTNYWYFCKDTPQGYYPYVKTCPSGWMKVVPPSQVPTDAPPAK